MWVSAVLLLLPKITHGSRSGKQTRRVRCSRLHTMGISAVPRRDCTISDHPHRHLAIALVCIRPWAVKILMRRAVCTTPPVVSVSCSLQSSGLCVPERALRSCSTTEAVMFFSLVFFFFFFHKKYAD